ncbi:serine/threonine-protein kinase [Chitiniphilus shinanonensis]|uniref:serine/threonine-protein kinase n=1 Tax=Chitiniphilus shinanonensis TaxID=553088 RepID=UPI00036B30D9|nr:serine/threonine-protein kinase [Chitiniphilus shinanonensis]
MKPYKLSTSTVQIAHYQLLGRLGKGAMGVVYRARDLRLERDVALKLLDVGDLGATQAIDYSTRLLQEARSAARLNHPGIITIYDCGTWEGQTYLAMELLEGRSLKTLLDQQGTLAVKQVVSLAKQMFDALEHAHAAQVVHRDIKPANLMLMANGRLKIMDFGIAQQPASELTQAGTLVGSPRYMAPEQITGQKQDGRADLFSVGIVLYEALTGQPPFAGDQPISIAYNILHTEPADPRTLQPDTPAWLAELILKCLAKQRDDRYPDAHAARNALLLGSRSARHPGADAAKPRRRPTQTEPPIRGVDAHGGAALGGLLWQDSSVLPQRLYHAALQWLQRARQQTAALGAALQPAWQRYRHLAPRWQIVIGAGVAALAAAIVLTLSQPVPEPVMEVERTPHQAIPTAADLQPTAEPLPVVKLSPWSGNSSEPAAEFIEPETLAPSRTRAATGTTVQERKALPTIAIRPATPQKRQEAAPQPVIVEPQPAPPPPAPEAPKQEAGNHPKSFREEIGSAFDCLRGKVTCPPGDPKLNERRGP